MQRQATRKASGRRWMGIGALWAAVGVGLGAFGAHALRLRLEDAGTTALWETAVRYHLVHALALVVFGLHRTTAGRPALGFGAGFIGWSFLLGSLFFSGSLYGLALDGPGAVLGPITPIGGALLIAAWIVWGVSALRASDSATPDGTGA